MFIFTRKKGLQKPKPFCIFAKGKKKKIIISFLMKTLHILCLAFHLSNTVESGKHVCFNN